MDAYTTEVRLARLERGNRRLRLLFVAITLAVSVVLLTGQADRRVVVAEEFTLVNAAGQMRAAIWVCEDGTPCLKMVDNQGRGRIGLFFREDGSPAFQLHDTAGQLRASLMLAGGTDPTIEFSDAQGRTRVVLDVNAEGEAILDMLDDNKKLRLALGLIGGELPAIALYNADGEPLYVAP